MSGEHANESFVARIWLEKGNNGDPILRGHIRHVQSEQEKYFQGLVEMREFLSQVSGVTEPILNGKSRRRSATVIDFSGNSED